LESFGFIKSKVEIKILILYILSRLPRPINITTLAELAMCDDGVNYFDFTEAISELVETQNVVLIDDKYLITAKGIANGSEVENSLPYTVRLAADRSTQQLSRIMKRNAMVETGHSVKDDGSCLVSLSLSDRLGSIMKLELLASGPEQAKSIEQRFKFSAEELYVKIAGMLLE
jgi:hypothetical protein